MSRKLWEPFRCDVIHDHDAVRVVPAGELDLSCVEMLRARLAAIFESGSEHVVLDLHELTFIDSTGLTTVIEASREAKERSIRFSLLPGPREVQRIFEVTATDGLFFEDASSR